MGMHRECDAGHEFVLVLSGVSDLSEEFTDALFEAGCDDCTPSLSYGRVYLSFDRVAPSMKEAALSAIRDVLKVKGVKVLQIDYCNLVTQAEIAKRVKRSRQQIHQLVSGERGPGNFPGPVCGITDGHPLWMWCDVAYWFQQNGIIKEEELADDRAIAAINTALDYLHAYEHDAEIIEEVAGIYG